MGLEKIWLQADGFLKLHDRVVRVRVVGEQVAKFVVGWHQTAGFDGFLELVGRGIGPAVLKVTKLPSVSKDPRSLV